MDIAGEFLINVPVRHAVEACHKPQNLELLLPVSGRIGRIDPTHYSLLLTPSTPLIKASFPGTLTITATVPGVQYDLAGEASASFFGTVRLAGTFEFTPRGKGCFVSYRTTLSASGLLSGLLRKREADLRERMRLGLLELRKRIIQDHPRGQGARPPAAKADG